MYICINSNAGMPPSELWLVVPGWGLSVMVITATIWPPVRPSAAFFWCGFESPIGIDAAHAQMSSDRESGLKGD